MLGVGLLEDLHAEEVASDLRVEDGVIEPDELDRLRPLQLLASRPVLDAQLGAAAAHPDPYPAYEGTPNDAAGVLCNTRDERQHALGCLEIDQLSGDLFAVGIEACEPLADLRLLRADLVQAACARPRSHRGGPKVRIRFPPAPSRQRN